MPIIGKFLRLEMSVDAAKDFFIKIRKLKKNIYIYIIHVANLRNLFCLCYNDEIRLRKGWYMCRLCKTIIIAKSEYGSYTWVKVPNVNGTLKHRNRKGFVTGQHTRSSFFFQASSSARRAALRNPSKYLTGAIIYYH